MVRSLQRRPLFMSLILTLRVYFRLEVLPDDRLDTDGDKLCTTFVPFLLGTSPEPRQAQSRLCPHTESLHMLRHGKLPPMEAAMHETRCVFQLAGHCFAIFESPPPPSAPATPAPLEDVRISHTSPPPPVPGRTPLKMDSADRRKRALSMSTGEVAATLLYFILSPLAT